MTHLLIHSKFIYYTSEFSLKIITLKRNAFYSVIDFFFFRLVRQLSTDDIREDGRVTFIWTMPTTTGVSSKWVFLKEITLESKKYLYSFRSKYVVQHAPYCSHCLYTESNRGISFRSRNFTEMSLSEIFSWILILIAAFDSAFIVNSLTGDHVCSRIEKLVSKYIRYVYNNVCAIIR